MKFNLQAILKKLNNEGIVIFTGKGLKVFGHPTDFEGLVKLLLKRGYRHVKKEDLAVGARLLFVQLSVDRVKRKPRQHSLAIYVIKITRFMPAEIVGQKREKAKERYGFDAGIAEDMYDFNSLNGAESKGYQNADFFISGYSISGISFPPFNSPDETGIFIIKN